MTHAPFMTHKETARFIALSLLFLVAIVYLGCGEGVEPVASAPSPAPLCSAISNTTGPVICIDGNGNTIVINPAPQPSPSASPGQAECKAELPLYQENVVAASVVPAQPSMAAHIAAVKTKLLQAGFQVTSGGTLPSDEIALKIGNAFSETYDVWRQDNTPQVLYQETCRPARF